MWYELLDLDLIWASLRENLSLGLPTKQYSNQSPKLHIDKLENRNFSFSKLRYGTFQKTNNKGTDQTALMRRLVCACVVCKPLKTGFLASKPICKLTLLICETCVANCS